MLIVPVRHIVIETAFISQTGPANYRIRKVYLQFGCIQISECTYSIVKIFTELYHLNDLDCCWYQSWHYLVSISSTKLLVLDEFTPLTLQIKGKLTKMLNLTDMFDNNTTYASEFSGNSSNVTPVDECYGFDIEKQYLKSFINTRSMIIISRLGVLSAIILIGLIGNTLAFIVMSKDKAGRDGNWMLRAVAINDNFFLIAMFCRWVLLEAYFQTPGFSNLRHWYPHVFPFFYYFGAVTLTTAHYTLVVATIERYIAVCKPHRNITLKKHTRRAVIALPIVAAILKLPQAFTHTKSDIPVCDDYYAAIVSWLDKHKEFQFYQTLLYGILHTLLPILILIFCNVNMILAVRASTKMQSTSHVASDRRLTIMLITVVLAFIVCNLPVSVVWIMEMLSDIDEKARGQFWIFALWVFLELLVVTNSSVNCFIYCFVGKKFRENLFDLICCKTKEGKNSSVATQETNIQEPSNSI